MSRKRQRRDLEDPALKDFNSIKRPRYDLRYAQARDCCSLPQYDKQPCQHKYHLRPFEHRKPVNYLAPKQSAHNISQVATRGVCANIQGSSIISSGDIQRNAHSYSINGYLTRCSNSSTASGRQRTLQALKKDKTTKKVHNLKEVSVFTRLLRLMMHILYCTTCSIIACARHP